MEQLGEIVVMDVKELVEALVNEADRFAMLRSGDDAPEQSFSFSSFSILLYLFLIGAVVLIGAFVNAYLSYNLGEKVIPQLLQQYCMRPVMNGTITL